jgi:GT2 family glycosyltransferase
LTLVRIEQLFDSAPRLGVVQTRIRTPDGATLRRWVPRLRDKNPLRGSLAFSALEGSLAVRADVLRLAGGWPGPFFYAHEGIELAWRAWDAGYVVEYRPEFEAIHPRTDLARHPAHLWHNARNRVWLAKRNLPLPVAFGYVATWTLFTFIRTWRHPREMRAWLRGCWVGLRATAGPRRPISWRTVWTMTRHGRPPIA